jgi:hypothetical protein
LIARVQASPDEPNGAARAFSGRGRALGAADSDEDHGAEKKVQIHFYSDGFTVEVTDEAHSKAAPRKRMTGARRLSASRMRLCGNGWQRFAERHARAQTRMRALTRAPTYTRARARAQMHTDTRMHARARMHRRTHACTLADL